MVEKGMERLPSIIARQEALEKDVERLENLVKSSVDDIKATIRSEVADLKSEQIGDLRKRVDDQSQRIEAQARSLGTLQRKQDQWDTARGLMNWLIRLAIALAGVIAGIFGAEHIRGPH